MKKNLALKIILLLSVLGILTSFYLIKNHYAGVQSGSFCDFSEKVSCSLVNTSIYSVLFHVPVAIFGALWFTVLALLSWRAKKKQGEKKYDTLLTLMLEWNVLGFLFVLYMIYAEIKLGAICPACTLVHIIAVITLVMSFLLYKKEGKVTFQEVKKAAKPWVALIIILNLIPLILFNLPKAEEKDYTPLAKCLTENNIVMYGSFRCGVCAKEKETFGDAFKEITYVECHPQGEHSEFERCQQKQIEGTPTWIWEPQGVELKRHRGYLSPEELAQFAGCPAP